ncbi:MAG: 16S rRNA (uracil(1498)-N(3))-methyltransferase [Rubricella sp.]
MADRSAKIRLFVTGDLGPGGAVAVDRNQGHYLINVMRATAGTRIACFNGRDGEWLCEIAEASRKNVVLKALEQTRPQGLPPDLRLLFAPIKKARTDFIVEKATEMGVRAIQPVFTRYTNSERIRPDKLRAHCIEAAEQCGGIFVPDLHEAVKLDQALAAMPADRALVFCDERMVAETGLKALEPLAGKPAAILVGPEGGFSEEEAERIRSLPNCVSVTLGPRILRADTAAVAALALWQAACGDWR